MAHDFENERPSHEIVREEMSSHALQQEAALAKKGYFPTFRALLQVPRRFWRGTSQVWRKAKRPLLILLLIVAVTHAALNIYSSILLNRELAAIQQKNEPLSFTELAPPAVPDAQNAALVYQQAVEALQIKSSEEIVLSQWTNAGTTSEKQNLNVQAQDILQRNQKAIQLIRRAAAMPACRFPVDWNKSPETISFPHYAELRKLARMMMAQAIQEARRGQTQAALQDVRAVFAIASHLQNEPVLIGFLVARAIDAMGNRALGQVLDVIALTPQEAHQFQASLPRMDWDVMYRRAMLSERCFTIWGFDVARSDSKRSREVFFSHDSPYFYFPTILFGPLRLLWMPFLKLDEVYALRLWKQKFAAFPSQQIPAPPNHSEFLDRQVQDAPFYAIVTKFMFPVFFHAHRNLEAVKVLADQREISLALACYRTQFGRYPAQLQQAEALWKQALPHDLYSTKPFIYRSDGKRFQLYSIGPNRVDDNGQGPYGRRHYNQTRQSYDDLMWNPPHP
jgi:hypothetical protein